MSIYKELAQNLTDLNRQNMEMLKSFNEANEKTIEILQEPCECYDCEMERAEIQAYDNAENSATGN